MIETVRNAWKIPDLRKKLLFVLFAIVVFRFGHAIYVPFVDTAALAAAFSAQNSSNLLGYFNVLSGGGLATASIFALSIYPYINSSIIVQLLQVAIPALERMAKDEGEEGKKKLQRITRYGTLVLAILMATGYYIMIRSMGVLTRSDVWAAIVIITTFVAGAMFVVWLGDQITEKGIGNGISVILLAGIVSQGYGALMKVISMPWWAAIIVLIVCVFIIAFIIYITEGERRIPVQYAKRVVGRKMYGGQSTHIPMKLLSVGVLPLIFAYSFMAFPGTILAMFGTNSGAYQWWTANMHQASPWYMIICALLIIAFSYFYTSITFNPQDIAKNIQQQGGHIPGIRTGSKTVEFLSRTSNRLTLFAALFLAILSTVPSVLSVWQNVSIPFGASSILIAVSVAIETVRQVESQLVMRNYKGFLG